MTGPEDFLRGLDDPAGDPTRIPAIDGVVGRGRQIRSRRYALATGSAAVLSTFVAVAAFGVVPGINAGRTGDNQVSPAQHPTSTASATAEPRKRSGAQVLKVAPHHHVAAPTHSPSPTPTTAPADPCTRPSPSPAVADPSATSQPSPAASDGTSDSDSSTPCVTPSPSASAPPSPATPTPADTPVVSATPAQAAESPQA